MNYMLGTKSIQEKNAEFLLKITIKNI